MLRAELRPSPAAAGVAAFVVLSGVQVLVPVAWITLVLVAAVLAWRGAIDLDRPFDAIEWAGGAWLAAMLLAAMLGLAPKQSLLTSVPVLSALIVWCLLVRGEGRAVDARWLGLGLALAALIQATMVAHQIMLDPAATPATWIAASATPWLVVPNDIVWFGAALPLIAASCGRFERVVGWILLGLFLLACVQLQSRTAGLVAAASFALYAGLCRRKAAVSWRTIAFCAASVLVVLPLLVLYVPSFTSRWQLWGAALHVLAQHPLLGVGPHNFATAAQPWLLILPDRVDPRVAPWPHNLLLEIAAETGFAGLACATWFGFGVASRIRNAMAAGCHRIHYAALAGLGGLAIASLVEASLLRVWVWNLGVVLCGLVLMPVRPCASLPPFSDGGEVSPGIEP